MLSVSTWGASLATIAAARCGDGQRCASCSARRLLRAYDIVLKSGEPSAASASVATEFGVSRSRAHQIVSTVYRRYINRQTAPARHLGPCVGEIQPLYLLGAAVRKRIFFVLAETTKRLSRGSGRCACRDGRCACRGICKRKGDVEELSGVRLCARCDAGFLRQPTTTREPDRIPADVEANDPISRLRPLLSERTLGALERSGVSTVGQLTRITVVELLRTAGFGKKSLAEVEAALVWLAGRHTQDCRYRWTPENDRGQCGCLT